MNLRTVAASALLVFGCAPSPQSGDGPSSKPAASAESSAEDSGGEALAPTEDPRPLGRWKSERLCLRLFENGDFELSVLNPGSPKVLIMGRAEPVAGTPDPTTLRLSVQRIWHARWLGPCRKEHITGDWAEQESALGATFAPGGEVTVKLTRDGEDGLEVCAETCVTMNKAPETLGARWRLAGLESPSNPKVAWKAGELLELDIDEGTGHVWAATDAADFATVYGSTEVKSVGGDRFEVSFTPKGLTDKHDGKVQSLYGRPLADATPRVFGVRRLAEERLEVCDGEEHCTILERQFDSYAYELE